MNSMNQIIIKDHQVQGVLPKGITFDEQVLSIQKNQTFQDPIKITLKDDNNESLEIVVGESAEVKIILEIASGTSIQIHITSN